MGKLRIAIVGCGGIANQKHMPSIKTQADKAEMVAFCDIIPERAEKAAKEYGVEGAKVYTDYKEMLADTSIEIDVVHVCTPNVAHCPITVAAFEAGKHVMCEKPMAHNTEDARKMIEAWKKSGKNTVNSWMKKSSCRWRKTLCPTRLPMVRMQRFFLLWKTARHASE